MARSRKAHDAISAILPNGRGKQEEKKWFFSSCSLLPAFSGRTHRRVHAAMNAAEEWGRRAEEVYIPSPVETSFAFACVQQYWCFLSSIHRMCAFYFMHFFFVSLSYPTFHGCRDKIVPTKPNKKQKGRKRDDRFCVGAKFFRVYVYIFFPSYYGWINFGNIHSLAYSLLHAIRVSVTLCLLSYLFHSYLCFMCANAFSAHLF